VAKYHLWLQIEEDDEAGPDDRRFVGEAVDLGIYCWLPSAITEALRIMQETLPHNDERITEYRLWHGRLMAERQARLDAEKRRRSFEKGDEVIVTLGGQYHNLWGIVKAFWHLRDSVWVEVMLYDRRVAMFFPAELAHRDPS
jgi:hypothetical protein